jgi:hypothetical protein
VSDQRPEWIPNDDAIRACSAVDHVESANMKLYVVTATGALLHKTGLRAQIAVLEEIWEEMPSEDFEEDEPLYRKDMVFLKIDALRKELKQ